MNEGSWDATALLGFVYNRKNLHHIGENLAQIGHWFKRYMKKSIDTVDLGSGQITVKEGRDGLARVNELVTVVIR